MISLHKTVDGKLVSQRDAALDQAVAVEEAGLPVIEPDAWIELTAPTEAEVATVNRACAIDIEDITAALDDEESPRVELFEGYHLIIIDVPVRERRNGIDAYNTVPLSLILTDRHLITTSLVRAEAIDALSEGAFKEVNTAKRLRLVYQMFFAVASTYQRFLRNVEAQRMAMESNLGAKTRNTDLVKLHELERDLVYFETSLRANKILLDRIRTSKNITHYAEDEELFDDVLVETSQAIEMASIYRSILGSTRDLFASVLDNTLNDTMKILTSVTILLAIPTLVAGLYGMNVATSGMPLGTHPFAFGLICLASLLVCAIAALLLHRRKLL